MKIFKQKLKGYSLVELVIAIGIFATISATLVLLVVDSTRTLDNTVTRAKATQLTQEVRNSIILLKTISWYNVAQFTDDGLKHLELVDGNYTILDGEAINGELTYSFQILTVQRDLDGNIVESGGTVDPHTRLVSIEIKWNDKLGQLHSISPKIYINDWNTNSIVYTTQEDFAPGSHFQTISVSNSDGTTRLQSRFYSDWCNPTLSMNEYDIPGSATPRSVFAELGHAYLGTKGSTTGTPFTKLNIEGIDPPILTVEGTFGGYTVNDIFVKDQYAFLATTDDNKELIILNISSLPYTEVGYYNASGSTDGYSIFVEGNIGYLAQGRYVRTINLSQYTGSRASIGSITVGGYFANVSQIYVKDTYMYAVLNWDWYELAIVNVSNPASMSITSQTSVNNQQVYDMYLSDDGTRVYFGTNNSSYEKEFFIIDTTQKTGARPIIASLDMGGTTVRGIEVVEDGRIAIVVGTGAKEYKVYNLTTETNPTYCGGMEIDNGIYDLDSIRDSLTNSFSYLVTGDTLSEFKIIRGGPGGGGEDGFGYYDAGTHTSSVYDTDSNTSVYRVISIDNTIPTGTSLGLQVRASNSSDMAGSSWVGPNGTSSTYFNTAGAHNLPTGVVGRYFQYRAVFASDTVNTPLLEELIINYDK